MKNKEQKDKIYKVIIKYNFAIFAPKTHFYSKYFFQQMETAKTHHK